MGQAPSYKVGSVRTCNPGECTWPEESNKDNEPSEKPDACGTTEVAAECDAPKKKTDTAVKTETPKQEEIRSEIASKAEAVLAKPPKFEIPEIPKKPVQPNPKIPNAKFDLVSSDNNFSAYLYEIGVGFAKRAIASNMKPQVEFHQDDGTYTINTYSALKNTTIKFKPGVEFDEETADGRIAKSTVTIDGNKMIHIQRIGNGESKIVREFQGNDMTAIFCANGVCSTRKYTKAA